MVLQHRGPLVLLPGRLRLHPRPVQSLWTLKAVPKLQWCFGDDPGSGEPQWRRPWWPFLYAGILRGRGFIRLDSCKVYSYHKRTAGNEAKIPLGIFWLMSESSLQWTAGSARWHDRSALKIMSEDFLSTMPGCFQCQEKMQGHWRGLFWTLISSFVFADLPRPLSKIQEGFLCSKNKRVQSV